MKCSLSIRSLIWYASLVHVITKVWPVLHLSFPPIFYRILKDLFVLHHFFNLIGYPQRCSLCSSSKEPVAPLAQIAFHYILQQNLNGSFSPWQEINCMFVVLQDSNQIVLMKRLIMELKFLVELWEVRFGFEWVVIWQHRHSNSKVGIRAVIQK